ncbi:hypothetical protein [Streptomyces yunnanensis]|uniref:hypothetical protein n=1 Tax=Streptomyces yunnanensis TaxID=156453 RepID=UPI00116107F2|nr:hypothetical protein [Streptomyces yunnanensis]
MADDRLTEIAARATAVTPGPWLQRSDAGIVTDAEDRPLAVFGTSGPHCVDATFIAHAPEDVRWLLAQLEQARAIAVELENENARLTAAMERRRKRLVAAEADLLDMRGTLSPSGAPRRVPMELGGRLTPVVEWLLDENARLTADLSKDASRGGVS